MATTTNINPLNEFEPEVWEQSSIHKIIQRAMTRPDAQTFKFNGDMVYNSKPLWDWAEYLVDHYVGDFELMVKLRTLQRTGSQLSKNQLAVALNTLLNCWKRSLKETAKAQEAAKLLDEQVNLASVPTFDREVVPNPEGGRPSIEPQDTIAAVKAEKSMIFKVQVQRPHDGTYTFVDQNGDYRVLQFRSTKQGDTYVSYQYGPDNVYDFAKCGKINKDGWLIVWGSAFPKGDAPCIDHTSAQRADLLGAIVFICSFDKDAQLKAGEAYALKSGNCFICGRELTVPSSISAGIGPVCAEKWGV